MKRMNKKASHLTGGYELRPLVLVKRRLGVRDMMLGQLIVVAAMGVCGEEGNLSASGFGLSYQLSRW